MPLGTEAFDAAMAAPENGDLRAFFAYWKSKQVDARPPHRGDIDPTEIPALLSNVLLIDIVGDPAYDFHYRLLGTNIVAVYGIDYAGASLSQMVPRTDVYDKIWEHHLHAAKGAIELRKDSLRWSQDDSRDHLDYLILLLPLRRRDDSVELLIGYIHYLTEDRGPGWSVH